MQSQRHTGLNELPAKRAYVAARAAHHYYQYRSVRQEQEQERTRTREDEQEEEKQIHANYAVCF